MDRFRGGLYGLLVGDALGVPYEFHSAMEIPGYDQIELSPPAGFPRTYPDVPPGTWSDDGAQALCLLESLLACGGLQLGHLADQLLDWYEHGKWAVDSVAFDVGIQTGNSLLAYKQGVPPERSGLIIPDGKGNGALMRVLPLALCHTGDDRALALDAHTQCLVTHGHVTNQVCCAFYCLIARRLMEGMTLAESYGDALAALRAVYRDMEPFAQELEWSVRPEEPLSGQGTGYVVDCLKSALWALDSTENYESAVKQAVALGNDTDTTACVAGGLAGVLYGVEGIPQRWLSGLRGRALVEDLLGRYQA